MTLIIAGESDITYVLMEIGHFAGDLDFNEVERSSIVTATAELTRNILKYAGRGRVSYRLVSDQVRSGIEIIAADHGPGIAEVNEAMRDHYSTGGSLGLGLPGVKRIMDEFKIESEPGAGTQITIIKWKS